MNVIKCFVDGGCKGNGQIDNKGSFGYVILENENKIYENSKSFKNTSNNKMELSGIISCLHYLKSNNYLNNEIKITTDSKYCIDGMNLWIINWKKNNWMRGKKLKQEVANVELWKELDNLYSSFPNISLDWIKGHQNINNWNDYVDNLCNEAVKTLDND